MHSATEHAMLIVESEIAETRLDQSLLRLTINLELVSKFSRMQNVQLMRRALPHEWIDKNEQNFG